MFEKAFPELRIYLDNEINSKIFWYFGIIPDIGNRNLFINAFLIMFKYTIWRTKLFKHKRGFMTVFDQCMEEMDIALLCSKKLVEEKNKLGLAICRDWDTITRRR